MTYKAPDYHPAFEEYCETIFELKEDDVEVIQARIADRLMVSRPAVSEMIKRLEGEGLVAIDHNAITLSPAGLRLAERVVRRHRLAERFLTDILDLSWADAHQEAGKWEHIISDTDGRDTPRRSAMRACTTRMSSSSSSKMVSQYSSNAGCHSAIRPA